MIGSITVVGIGPGDLAHLTPVARQAIEAADVIVGYVTYLRLIESLAPGVSRVSSGMRKEVERVASAIEFAQQGQHVAVVSSGDSGIYGMAGLVYEMLDSRGVTDITVEVVPGITALSMAAALLGAPLMTDFAVISLSDQLIPQADILRRVELAAQADFVIGLYNPKGKKRVEAFERACRILARYRQSSTPVGVVRSAARTDQQVSIITLAELPEAAVDMLTILVIGSSHTRAFNGRMVTPRGYGEKYELGSEQDS